MAKKISSKEECYLLAEQYALILQNTKPDIPFAFDIDWMTCLKIGSCVGLGFVVTAGLLNYFCNYFLLSTYLPSDAGIYMAKSIDRNILILNALKLKILKIQSILVAHQAHIAKIV